MFVVFFRGHWRSTATYTRYRTYIRCTQPYWQWHLQHRPPCHTAARVSSAGQYATQVCDQTSYPHQSSGSYYEGAAVHDRYGVSFIRYTSYIYICIFSLNHRSIHFQIEAVVIVFVSLLLSPPYNVNSVTKRRQCRRIFVFLRAYVNTSLQFI